MHAPLRAIALLGAIVVLAGCVPEHTSPPPITRPAPTQTAEAPETDAAASATFLSVIDGDTITTSAGTVRIIGIDSPERGECGYDEASLSIGRLIAHGDTIALTLPEGQNDTDRHERLLRHVTVPDGSDLGLHQIESGNAVARYDSRDGYPAHPLEDAYRAAQIAERGTDGTVITLACQAPTTAPPTAAPPTDDAPWWQQYPSCAQLKRNDRGHPTGPFDVNDPEDHDIYLWFAYGTGNNGDGDSDGLACE